MTPNTLDSDVPPLNTRWGANAGCENSTPNSQHTQKSFSMMTGSTARWVAAC